MRERQRQRVKDKDRGETEWERKIEQLRIEGQIDAERKARRGESQVSVFNSESEPRRETQTG